MLTRKYYKAIAGIISNSKDREDLINNFCRYLSMDNPNFSSPIFERACSPEYADLVPKGKQDNKFYREVKA